MALAKVALDDKYTALEGRIYLTGTQALVRLPLVQRRRDLAAGLNTAGFVTGYRGSPLGNVDKEYWRAESLLKDSHIHFQPGVNEDLAATAIWGSQQVNLFEGARYDGVFAMWYGKGPGVDRSGDVFRHGNFAGTSAHGGVLLLAGDDPACKSSTVPSQSEHALADAQIPVLNPANVQEVLDFGIIGWAMSRYSGCWVGMKTITENVDASAAVRVDPDRIAITLPDDFEIPEGGLHIRWPDPPLDQERRLQQYKIYAALAFARANGLDTMVIDSPRPRLGIISTGKSFLDVLQALEDLGIDESQAAEIGLRVYKVGMPWPLEREGVRHFAEGLEEILVVEEKRAVIENQMKEQLYNWRASVRPRVVGKFDEEGTWILPSAGELTPARIARVIAERIDRFYTSPRIKERLEILERREKVVQGPLPDIQRVPYFCSGCPHNTSTKVPEGSRALAGIGCHYMVTWMDRDTQTFTHMGGEGASWIGQAPFTKTEHTFVNLGDGTYFHSGLLAVRAAVAAGVNITYKILYNDAVAMTGGQPMDGPLSVPMITRQLSAEGIGRIAVVSEGKDRYAVGDSFAPHVTFHGRGEMDALQRELRRCKGVSVLVYDQTCAAELRRRRKRGLAADPPRRAFINQAVCEGCGDCGVQSNCVSIIPVETEWGRKRAIDQSSCNKDFSCINGFCPSFVTVHGGGLRKQAGAGADAGFPDPGESGLPEPRLPGVAEPYGIAITGIGGTGVVTVGALLGMAAHMEGRGVSVLDMAGLAQKNGAVVTHVRIAEKPERIHAARIAAGGANVLLGCDLVTAGSAETLGKIRAALSHSVINNHQTMTAAFTQDPDVKFPQKGLMETIAQSSKDAHFIDATGLATALMGDSIASNLFMVGFAYQKGLLPVSAEAIIQAIGLNGVAVDFNKKAFLWGRRAAHDMTAVEKTSGLAPRMPDTPSATTRQDTVRRHREALTAYQDNAYAERHRALVEQVRTKETEKGLAGLAETVAENYYRLLAYKDEYEVARLYSADAFRRQLDRQFEGDFTLSFHLAPPLLATRDPVTGVPRKREYGGWMMNVFNILAKGKGLRGTVFDIFGYGQERKLERALIGEYEQTVDQLLAGLNADNHALAVEISALPQTIRGFGHVKLAAMERAKARRAELMDAFRDPALRKTAAE